MLDLYLQDDSVKIVHPVKFAYCYDTHQRSSCPFHVTKETIDDYRGQAEVVYRAASLD